jgi:hypothetical protein
MFKPASLFCLALATITMAGFCDAASIKGSDRIVITKSYCTSKKLGTSIPSSAIGEPVSAVTLDEPVWTEGSGNSAGYCTVSGTMDPVDTSDTARPIKFKVKLPATWNLRSAQQGGGGLDGSVPDFSGRGPGGGTAMEGFVLYGSDSGHSSTEDEWSLNDEAIRNFGYMQLKKTHDAAMVLIDRMYGKAPVYNYFIGTSEGGREAITVAQRYPKDYDGVSASVPVVSVSTLMLAPALMRMQEKDLDNWVPATKAKAVAYEFVKQCDGLDGLTDGIINNYMACREIFNVNDGGKSGENDPWKNRRCANNVDPDPDDDSINACLTDGQIETLEFVFSSYKFPMPLANNVTSFGMFDPTTSPGGGMMAGSPMAGAGAAGGGNGPSGQMPTGMSPQGGMPGDTGGISPMGEMPSGGMPGGMSSGDAAAGGMPGGGMGNFADMMAGANLLVSKRYKGQEGADADAATHTHGAGIGVTGMLMKDLTANPLVYKESDYTARRIELSEWLDSTDPDFSAFYKLGGKMIVSIGAMDSTASSGSQLDFYQSVVETMGEKTLDNFARLYVSPQGGHGMGGTKFSVDGDGNETGSTEIPGTFDQFSLLRNWVENGIAPGKSVVATGANNTEKSIPLCSYPTYPKYISGDASIASSYSCAKPWE